MKTLRIDIETKSDVDIGKCGVFKYVQSEEFGILLLSYKIDDTPTICVDLAKGEKVPDKVIKALADSKVIKSAYNATFEWCCLNRAGYSTPIDQWQCTMIAGLYAGYPAGLKAIGEAIGLPQEKQKLSTGSALIRYFCVPCRPTKSNGGRTWNLPEHEPEKWELFKEYNIQDVDTEYEIGKRLSAFKVPEEVWKDWRRDVELNARGVRIDMDLVNGALSIDAEANERLMARSKELTGLSNPNSTAQLQSWLEGRLGYEIENVRKETVTELLKSDIPEDVREVLELRQKLGKTSTKKYEAMASAVGEGDRVRGLLQFYGANRSGRWAGRLVQVQNLPRNYIEPLAPARDLVKSDNLDGLKLIYGPNVPDTLSQLIRTAFVPTQGNKFIVSDFSAIEARVIAWLSGETWAIEVFETTGKIYEATASQMFHVPAELIVKGNPEYSLRQKGKVATLALGYQGGPNALVTMGALNMGIAEDELQDIVDKWRTANPHIVETWKVIEWAALKCVETRMRVTPKLKSDDFLYDAPVNELVFDIEENEYGNSALSIKLPSGRKLYYVDPSIEVNKFDRPAPHYWNLNQTNKKWQKESTYGGKLTENIVQAIARDCLAVTLNRVIDAGYKPVMHIHDEIVIDADQAQHLDDVNKIFAQPIDWAKDLPLKGAGFESEFYMKD